MVARLTYDKRMKLIQLAHSIVECPEEARTIHDTYKIAAPLVRAAVEVRYPRKDMLICKKYDVAAIDDCIKITHVGALVSMFTFKKGRGPLAAKSTTQGIIYQTDAATFDAVENWVNAVATYKKAKERKLTDYRSLINHARTYEQVLAVWPEAEAVRSDMGSQALIVMSDEVLDRIRSDVEARKGQKPVKVDVPNEEDDG